MVVLHPDRNRMPSDGLWGDGSGYIAHTSTDYAAYIAEDVIDCMAAPPPRDHQKRITLSKLARRPGPSRRLDVPKILERVL